MDFSNCCFRGANISGGLFHKTDFKGADLTNVIARNCNFIESDFTNANLLGLDLGIFPDLIGHSGSVSSVCFSPDGKKIVTGSGDKTAKIWNAETGKLI